MLKIKYRHAARKMPKADMPTVGPEGRINKLRKIVTALVRHERIEGKTQHIDEARGYAERLLYLASTRGEDEEMKEIADYWLLEKDLIPKLFKVLVPRYSNHKSAYTSMYRLPSVYPNHYNKLHMSLLELKGNPWPPIPQQQHDVSGTLLNILVDEAKKEYRKQKFQEYSELREKLMNQENEQQIENETEDFENENETNNHSVENKRAEKVEEVDKNTEQTDKKDV